MKKITALFALATLLILGNNVFSQKISKSFFGENAWMPDTIGDVNNCQEPPCLLRGKLHANWDNIKNSGVGVIRFGGIAADRNMPTKYQYIKMIDAIRAKGMEPIIQVPFRMNRYNAAQAAEIVKYINVTKGKHIKYWVIANEPDLGYKYTSASQIAVYFKAYATAMKAVDPTIKTIGPETAWYNEAIINGLTNPGGPDDITGKDANGRFYADIISFHAYPFNGTQTRSQVISELTASGKFQDDLTALNKRLDNCNSYHNRTGDNVVRTAVTEANIGYVDAAGDNLNGLGTNSFIGGQFWAEMMAIGMKKNVAFINFWSAIEGSEIGYISQSGKKKPTYYHMQMMAENFRGTYADGTDNQTNVKAFGAKDADQIVVMILNQDQSTDHNYTVRLNKSAVQGSGSLKINIDANVDKEYSGKISNESSTLLVFDAEGNILKKIEYKLNGNADQGIAPTVIQIANNITTSTASNKEEMSDAAFNVNVFPNPSNGVFNVKMNTAGAPVTDIKMEVVNMAGQVVYSKKPTVENSHINEKIENQNFAAGLYIVQVKMGGNSFNTKMMIAK